tara:strand:+ start:562 stop:810 length:249 start_codon:yes stop_codon:yes gene_type:complete
MKISKETLELKVELSNQDFFGALSKAKKNAFLDLIEYYSEFLDDRFDQANAMGAKFLAAHIDDLQQEICDFSEESKKIKHIL